MLYVPPKTPKPSKLRPIKTGLINLRLTDEQKERFVAAADVAGMSLSTWLRIAGNEKLARDAKE